MSVLWIKIMTFLYRGMMVCLLAGVMFWLVGSAAFPRLPSNAPEAARPSSPQAATLPAVGNVAAVDAALQALWSESAITPTKQADEFTILRRLSLALHGTIPSLEEIRRFQADSREQRLHYWAAALLDDPRFPVYWSERLARVFVGTQGEPFLIFRRDRFKDWIAEQLKTNRSYQDWVQELIARNGLWTGDPATNFITHAVIDGQPDEAKLAGRTMRAFLGQRIDCAECHDHPFADWKQHDFQGIAAFYGQVKISPFGVEDDPEKSFQVLDQSTQQERTVQPQVPFGSEWLPSEGTQRQQLALWCTSPENHRFARATVNRVWGILFGKALSEGAPYYTAVDDLPDPAEGSAAAETVLEVLAADFIAQQYDLRKLILTITACRAFRLSSESTLVDERDLQEQIDHWAVFPLVRLRPEQVVGSMLQATSLKTIDQNSALLTRTIRFFRELDFVREYGDLGEDELQERSGTVPQALLRMNGKLVQETTEPNPFNATPRIALVAATPAKSIETCFLTCLTRLPTAAEQQHFLQNWESIPHQKPAERVQDLYWILFNSPEFSWNH